MKYNFKFFISNRLWHVFCSKQSHSILTLQKSNKISKWFQNTSWLCEFCVFISFCELYYQWVFNLFTHLDSHNILKNMVWSEMLLINPVHGCEWSESENGFTTDLPLKISEAHSTQKILIFEIFCTMGFCDCLFSFQPIFAHNNSN